MTIKIPAGSSFLNTPAIRAILEKQKKKPNQSPAAIEALDKLLARPLPTPPAAKASTKSSSSSTASTPASTASDGYVPFKDTVKRPKPSERWGKLNRFIRGE